MSLFRPAIDALAPYVPGEQPREGDDVLKLNTNENPYPPSPRAMAVARQVGDEWLRCYPHPHARPFQLAAADVLQIEPSEVLVGNGSDDILTMLLRSAAGPGRAVAYATPTYVLYRTLAQMQEAPVIEVNYGPSYELPVDALAGAGAALTLVANPNSPSGTLTALEALETLADRVSGILAVDEAYAEFAETTALGLTRRRANVVVIRTLSKSHSLAGLRLGYAVGDPTLLEGLAKVKDSYNVDAIAARVGAAAIRDTAHTRAVVRRVVASRRRLVAGLERLGFEVWPSEANFVLARPPGGDAAGLQAALRTRGVLVRHFDAPRLSDRLRITVGTDRDTQRLLDTLADLAPPR